jgi:hypothetical protein
MKRRIHLIYYIIELVQTHIQCEKVGGIIMKTFGAMVFVMALFICGSFVSADTLYTPVLYSGVATGSFYCMAFNTTDSTVEVTVTAYKNNTVIAGPETFSIGSKEYGGVTPNDQGNGFYHCKFKTSKKSDIRANMTAISATTGFPSASVVAE